ncbi:MAG: hypothetical protein AAF415_13000 [Pseudomonadota bacterium]
MRKRRPIVTDHAIVRYLERGLGVNIEGLRKRIEKRAALALQHNADGVRIDGLTFKIAEGRVTTILETQKRRKRRRVKAAK